MIIKKKCSINFEWKVAMILFNIPFTFCFGHFSWKINSDQLLFILKVKYLKGKRIKIRYLCSQKLLRCCNQRTFLRIYYYFLNLHIEEKKWKNKLTNQFVLRLICGKLNSFMHMPSLHNNYITIPFSSEFNEKNHFFFFENTLSHQKLFSFPEICITYAIFSSSLF